MFGYIESSSLLLKLRPEVKDEKILTAAAAAPLPSPTGLPYCSFSLSLYLRPQVK